MLSPTERTRHRRLREQGVTDRSVLHSVLATGFVCHLGVVVDGTPMVLPTVYGFTAETLYFHGSVASRSLTQDSEVCVTVTHVDGLVVSRSVFEHGVNYRSAMIYGRPRVVADEEKLLGLRVLTEHCAPGQWEYARQPSRKELAATTLLALDLAEASVKVRQGPPDDAGQGDDLLESGAVRWAGVLPLHTGWGTPEPDPALPPEVAVPAHLHRPDRLSSKAFLQT